MGSDSDIDRKDPQWAELSKFLGAYLHQNFDAEYAEPWDALLDYESSATHDRKHELARQVRRFLALLAGDRELGLAADRFGMAYYPPGDGYSSYRYWLTAVAEHLEDPVAHPGPPERDAPVPRQEGAGGRASTFTDREVAEWAVAENLRRNAAAIERWRRAAGPNRAFECDHGETIGRLAPPDATLETIHDVQRSRVVLRRTTEAAEGWFVLVAYPVATPDPAVAKQIDRSAPEWDALWTLGGGYLHQDFDIHGGVDGAVGAFEAEALDGQPTAAASAIRRLLGGPDEAPLAAATEWLGIDYHPPGDGHSFPDWLATLAERLDRPDDHR